MARVNPEKTRALLKQETNPPKSFLLLGSDAKTLSNGRMEVARELIPKIKKHGLKKFHFHPKCTKLFANCFDRSLVAPKTYLSFSTVNSSWFNPEKNKKVNFIYPF